MMRVQFIKEGTKDAYAVLAIEEYKNLVRVAENASDILDAAQASAAIEAGEETVPMEMTMRMVNGENPVRVWREYRGLTQKQLAGKATITQAAVSAIEAGTRPGVDVAGQLAGALGVDIDDLF